MKTLSHRLRQITWHVALLPGVIIYLACGGDEPDRRRMMPMMGQSQMRESMQQMMGDMLPIGVEPSQLPDPDSRGAELLSRYCSQCHGIPSPRLHTGQEWPNVLTRMVKRMRKMEFGGMGMMQIESPSQAELGILSSYLGVHSMVGMDPQRSMEMTGPGADAFREICSACHALPDPRQHTRDEWPAVVDRMTRNMRSLDRVVPSDRELEHVITFLRSNAPTGG